MTTSSKTGAAQAATAPYRPTTEDAHSPTVDEMCDWLSSGPSLDEVAPRLRRLRLVHHELTQAIELLRQHALIELGERSLDPAKRCAVAHDEEPF